MFVASHLSNIYFSEINYRRTAMIKRIRKKCLGYVLFFALLLALVMAADAASVLIHQYDFNGSGVTD